MATLALQVRAKIKPIRGLPEKVSLNTSHTGLELYQQIGEAIPLAIHRLRISQDKNGHLVVPRDRNLALTAVGFNNGDTIFVKDLGPQLGWRTVYIIEYFGPLFIHPLLFRYRLKAGSPTPSQVLALYLVLVHFAKREIESIFVHRFSNATMPARNVVKNSAHYWLLSGVLLAWFVYSPPSPAERDSSVEWDPTRSFLPTPNVPLLTSLPVSSYIGLLFYTLGASLNTYIHWIQRSLRPPGTTIRRVPYGPGFSWVTCPNYLFETVAWIGIWMVSGSWATAIFIVVAVAQMAAWAKKKEMRYRRESGERYVPKRYVVIPGVI